MHRTHGERVLADPRRREARRLGADVERQQVESETHAADLDHPRRSVDAVRRGHDEPRAGARREGAQIERELALGVDPLEVTRHHARVEVALAGRDQSHLQLPRWGERRPRRLGEQVNVGVSAPEEDESAGCPGGGIVLHRTPGRSMLLGGPVLPLRQSGEREEATARGARQSEEWDEPGAAGHVGVAGTTGGSQSPDSRSRC